MEEVLFGRIRMTIPDAQFRVSTDSMVLADFCTLPPRSAVCDLGCGCGSLSLLLCGKYPQAQLTGMELQEEAAVLAAQHSRAKDSAQVPVDYTQIRYVSKPQGAKPGMVIYVQYKTVYVDPTTESKARQQS